MYSTLFLITNDKLCFPLVQVRSLTHVPGKVVPGNSPGPTSWRGISANTRAKNRSSATSASGRFRAPTTCRCTWSDTDATPPHNDCSYLAKFTLCAQNESHNIPTPCPPKFETIPFKIWLLVAKSWFDFGLKPLRNEHLVIANFSSMWGNRNISWSAHKSCKNLKYFMIILFLGDFKLIQSIRWWLNQLQGETIVKNNFCL